MSESVEDLVARASAGTVAAVVTSPPPTSSAGARARAVITQKAAGVVFGLDVAEQTFLQPPAQMTDITTVIKGVIEAESGAIAHYTNLIEATEDVDPVTADMVTTILHDEEGHRRLFEGFLREYEER